MSELNPEKLHVTFQGGIAPRTLTLPRRYTLTHSDATGDLFLTIGVDYDRKQVSNLYTRLMRDEVFAEFKPEGQRKSLHVYCHVSGGLVFGGARMRNDILHHHMRMVLEAIHHGERELIAAHPQLEKAQVWVHFASHKPKYDQVEDWGLFQKYG
jgi:hypothetical protein